MPIRILLLFLLGVWFSATTQAQQVAVDRSAERQAIAPFVEYYEDASESLGIEDLLAPGFDVNFLPYDRQIINFGLSSSTYWLRFSLDWPANDGAKILEVGPPKIVGGLLRGGVELFRVDDSGEVIDRHVFGEDSGAELNSLSRGFALPLEAGLEDEYYLRVSSARPLRMPLTLWAEGDFREAQVRGDVYLGLQYGILLALAFYNLFLFFTIRESSYIYYVLMIVTQAAFIFLDTKHLRYLLDQLYQSSWLVDISERLIYPLLAITALLFQRALLRIWQHNPGLNRALLAFVAAFGLVALLTLLPSEKPFQYLFIFLVIGAIPLSLYCNFDAIRRGDITALIHLVAMAAFLSGTVILMLLQIWPQFPNNGFTENAYDVGLILQALLMSLSLAFRYNQIKQEKEDAQLMAINNLVRSEQVKDDLLANVSHELRTPLYGINGLAEAALIELENERSDGDLVARNLELIRTSGDRLTNLVNDLLDFSSARDETTYVKFRPVDLNSVVTLVMAVCRPLLDDKRIELRAELDPDLPLVSADEDRLQQILVNLTTNAIKFTYSGEVVIAAELKSEHAVTISVRDTGIGIHETDHETIFKTFEKLPSYQMNATGLGLGLPLAKRMVEMHRSKLQLQSELDLGSTFSFDLRVSLDQTQAVQAPTIQKQIIRRADFNAGDSATEELPKLRSNQETTIIVVDDDEINRLVMTQQLDDYNVLQCSNGLDALNLIAEEKPDLLLLDLMMPGINGYEVCQKLRQKFNQIELPIILVTAKNHLEDLTQGFETGANDYLPKPFHAAELRSRVENQLRLSMLHRIHEDNVKLRSQIESYADADRELRSSRLRLQLVLESIQEGFIAFELPGRIFTLNRRAAELLGSDRELLMEKRLGSLLTDDEVNEDIRNELRLWENGDIESGEGAAETRSVSVTIEVYYPYASAEKSSSRKIRFDSKLTLFGSDEGTGVLFLEQSDDADQASTEQKIRDTVELVSFLGQAQQSIRHIGTRLSVMTPAELSEHPRLMDKLSGIDDVAQFIDEQLPEVSVEGEYRQQLVTLMRSALHTWEVTTQKTKIELAEESSIWAVSIDEGRLRTRTFDRYLRLEQLPKIPRWREVVRTAYFVLSNPSIEPETRASLEKELEKTKAILKKAAIT